MNTIGVFDSGVGGLSVLRALRAEMPDAHFVYVADSAYAPYGERDAAAVIDRSQRITARLRQEFPLDTMVVACNTATALAIDSLRTTHHDLPFVGVEPALKPAAALSHTRHIGVMATRGTLESARYHRLRTRLEQGSEKHPPRFFSQPCDGLADAIERDDRDLIRVLCERYVAALREQAPQDQPIDTLVMGCTHYPFEARQLQTLWGSGVRLVETGAPVARRTREVLRERGLVHAHIQTRLDLMTTGVPDMLATVAERWLAIPVQPKHWTC